MENVCVKFISKDTNREISIDMKYDADKGNLDYNTSINPPFEENENGGLTLFLANMFLKTLVDPTDSNTPETTNAD